MKINPKFVTALRHCTTVEELRPLVQNAIELEHATIPPYLCGYFTLKPGHGMSEFNKNAAEVIRSVVIEEMLHLTIAANLLISIGGKPAINSPDFVPTYPGDLPMGIGDNLQIHLRKCSIGQVLNTFMAIEEPEDPIDIPKGVSAMAAVHPELPEFDTIGAFYHFLSMKIGELGDGIFVPGGGTQVLARRWFPEEADLFPITDVASAQKAIEVIVEQGEGSHTDPFDGDGLPAHYYRFEEIVKGRKLEHAPGKKPPYRYSGDPVYLDPNDVWDMDDDPAIAKYKPGSFSRRICEQFSYTYTHMLGSLHDAFNGQPERLDDAMGIMYELRLISQQVLETPAEWADPGETAQKQTGLSFEYQPLNLAPFDPD